MKRKSLWLFVSVVTVVLGLVLLTGLLVAQYPPHLSNPPRVLVSSGLVFVPSVAADLYNYTVHIDMFTLSNVTASAVTVTIKDKTTNCGSAACAFLNTVPVAANTAYVVSLPGGVQFTGGVNWVASSASAIVASVRGSRY